MPDQFVLLLLGPVISGKTTFLKQLVNNVPDGHPTSPKHRHNHMSGLQHTRRHARLGGLVIDTPGFNDAPRENMAVLKKIAEKIAEFTVDSAWRVTGVIYFHRITDVRLTGPARNIIKILEKICGSQFYTKVAVVTTMWNSIAKEELQKYYRLHESFGDKFAHLTRPDTFFKMDVNNLATATRVCERLVSLRAQNPNVALQLETEVRNRGASASSVRKTEAGKEIERSMEKTRCTLL